MPPCLRLQESPHKLRPTSVGGMARSVHRPKPEGSHLRPRRQPVQLRSPGEPVHSKHHLATRLCAHNDPIVAYGKPHWLQHREPSGQVGPLV